MARTSYDGLKYDTKYDTSYSVKAYSTFYYNKYYADGQLHIDMIGTASGGWDIQDYAVRIDNQIVKVGQEGPSRMGCSYCNDPITAYPSGTSWSYSAPSSWVDLVGHGDRWTLVHPNHY